MGISPYDHQIAAMKAIGAVWQKGGSPLLCSPTGSGKTVTFSLMSERIARSGNSVSILVHRQELIQQTCLTLAQVGIRTGVIAPETIIKHVIEKAADSGFLLNQRSPVQVSSIQTLAARLSAGRPVPITDYLIIDEAHHSVASSWRRVIEHYKTHGARILGCTATPERRSGEGLSEESGGFFSELVMGPPLEELVRAGRIAEPVIYYPKKHFEKDQMKKIRGDWRSGDMKEQGKKIIGDILGNYKTHFDGSPVLVFCGDLSHCDYMREVYRGAGWKAEVVDGRMKESVRSDRIAAIGDGRLNQLISCELIGEGLDVPSVAGAQLLRLTTSRTLLYQQIGRALRIAPGKTKGIILDHAGNFSSHAHPYEIREADDWAFHGRKKKETGQETNRTFVICGGCRAVYPARARRCPECGAERKIEFELPKEIDGELVRMEARKYWTEQTGWSPN